MRFPSKKARYAFHGLVYIAAVSRGNPVPFEEVLAYLRAYSSRLTLSPGYIAKIFQDLSRIGFTEAVSGPHGGYQLARSADEINMVQIIEALDGPLLSECCLMNVGGCQNQRTCGVRRVIHEAQLAQYRVFERETLASLATKVSLPDAATIQAYREKSKALN